MTPKPKSEIQTKMVRVGEIEVDASPDMTEEEVRRWVAKALEGVPDAPPGDKPD